MKPALAVASALVCGLLLPLGTGAFVWLWLFAAWVLLSVPVSLLVGRLMKRQGRD